MKVSPNKTLLSLLIISIVSFAYVLRIAERPAAALKNDMNFGFYSNSIWCILVTICTSINKLSTSSIGFLIIIQ